MLTYFTPQRIPTSPLDLHGFQGCLTATGNQEAPPAEWLFIRDARSLLNAGENRRAVIDAATAAELAMTTLIDKYLATANTDEIVRTALVKRYSALEGRTALLRRLRSGLLSDQLQRDLIEPRNFATHGGHSLTDAQAQTASRYGNRHCRGGVSTRQPLAYPNNLMTLVSATGRRVTRQMPSLGLRRIRAVDEVSYVAQNGQHLKGLVRTQGTGRAGFHSARPSRFPPNSQGVGFVPFQQRLGSTPGKEVLGVVKPAGSDNRKSGVDLAPAILASACLTAASMRSLRSRHCRSPTPPPREYPSWRT
jgi:hypothetical protein